MLYSIIDNILYNKEYKTKINYDKIDASGLLSDTY